MKHTESIKYTIIVHAIITVKFNRSINCKSISVAVLCCDLLSTLRIIIAFPSVQTYFKRINPEINIVVRLNPGIIPKVSIL